ncbi:ATP-binding protein [Streptomyces sp. NPDC052020]|uniref:ATP-binding protein n=1 Tax=Streptomyces sp. NPDC052020 TaxID=3155677 RepID=UPI00343BE835
MASVIPSARLGTDATGAPAGLGAASGAGPAKAVSERRFRFELAAHPGSPAQARRLTRARLTGWSVCEDTCDTAALVVSELVTNAIVHTAGRRVVCELHDGEGLVRIAVRDEGCAAGRPEAARRRPEEEHGRGLLLVDALSHAWGAHEHGPGLLVWAELPRQADAPRQPSEPRGDLGWGTRPKPGTSGGQGDADDAGGSGASDESGDPAASDGSGDSGGPAGSRAARTGHGENQTHHESRAAWL